MLLRLFHRFLRGDQYAIALVLPDKGKVVLGVLACPNLSLASIGINNQDFSQSEVGLFFAKLSGGTYMQFFDGSSPLKVNTSLGFNRQLYVF